jgi:hypothetical protein
MSSEVSRGSGPDVGASQSARSIITNSSPSGSRMLSALCVMAMNPFPGERAVQYPHQTLTLIIAVSPLDVKESD